MFHGTVHSRDEKEKHLSVEFCLPLARFSTAHTSYLCVFECAHLINPYCGITKAFRQELREIGHHGQDEYWPVKPVQIWFLEWNRDWNKRQN